MAFPLLATNSTAHPNAFPEFARADPILSSMPGLFRNIDAEVADAQLPALRVSHSHADWTVDVLSPRPLGGAELAVLQALTALAGRDGTTVMPDMPDSMLPIEQRLVAALEVSPVEAAVHFNALGGDLSGLATGIDKPVQHLSFSDALLRGSIGLPDGKPYRLMIERALANLATVVLLVYRTNEPAAKECYHLLAAECPATDSRRMHRTHVLLNPRLTQFVLRVMPQDTRIALCETRDLGTNQIRRILHQRLCVWINVGRSRQVSYRTLLDYVYPDDAMQHQLDGMRRGVDSKFARINPSRLQALRMNSILVELERMLDILQWQGELKRGSGQQTAGGDPLDTVLSIKRASGPACKGPLWANVGQLAVSAGQPW